MSNKINNELNRGIQDDLVLSNVKNDLILSDQREALSALSMDDEFVENLISQKTLKGVQKLFSNRGVILSEEEIDSFIEMVKSVSSKEQLPDEFFEDAAAGVLNNQGMHRLVNSTADIINGTPESKEIYNSVFCI